MKSKIKWMLCLVSTIGYGQINYEHSYPTYSPQYNIFFITDLGYNNLKYVSYDCYSDKVSLYHLDHSLFMEIQIPITSDTCTLFSIGFITSALFDCDSSTIEYALLPESPIYPFKIYRFDGTQLFSKDSVYGYWCYGCQEASTEIRTIVNTPAGTKLFLHYPWGISDSVLVYGLCGSLPTTFTEVNLPDVYLKVFPNPTSRQVSFSLTAPNNHEQYELTVLNGAFQSLETLSINSMNTQVNFNTESLSSGVYYYSLKNKNRIFQTGRFVLVR